VIVGTCSCGRERDTARDDCIGSTHVETGWTVVQFNCECTTTYGIVLLPVPEDCGESHR